MAEIPKELQLPDKGDAYRIALLGGNGVGVTSYMALVHEQFLHRNFDFYWEPVNTTAQNCGMRHYEVLTGAYPRHTEGRENYIYHWSYRNKFGERKLAAMEFVDYFGGNFCDEVLEYLYEDYKVIDSFFLFAEADALLKNDGRLEPLRKICGVIDHALELVHTQYNSPARSIKICYILTKADALQDSAGYEKLEKAMKKFVEAYDYLKLAKLRTVPVSCVNREVPNLKYAVLNILEEALNKGLGKLFMDFVPYEIQHGYLEGAIKEKSSLWRRLHKAEFAEMQAELNRLNMELDKRRPIYDMMCKCLGWCTEIFGSDFGHTLGVWKKDSWLCYRYL